MIAHCRRAYAQAKAVLASLREPLLMGKMSAAALDRLNMPYADILPGVDPTLIPEVPSNILDQTFGLVLRLFLYMSMAIEPNYSSCGVFAFPIGTGGRISERRDRRDESQRGLGKEQQEQKEEVEVEEKPLQGHLSGSRQRCKAAPQGISEGSSGSWILPNAFPNDTHATSSI